MHEGKISGYKEEYNGFQLFKNLELMKDFINYGLQDSVALYNALVKALYKLILSCNP